MSTTEVLNPSVSIATFIPPAIQAAPALQTRRSTPSWGRGSNRWGVILAGEDGTGLRELTQLACGDDRPKQFCPLLGNSTLLEETRKRAEKSIHPKQILFPVIRAHEHYYLRYLADRASQRIVQPCNKGTAPAILSALMRIARIDPEAVVAILPCGHYYSSDSAFTSTLESAFKIAEQQADSVVLLGAEAKYPEIEYNWIELGQAVHGRAGLFRVKGFQEKPPVALAQDLFSRGSLWNTSVMVGQASLFLELARNTVPHLLHVLESECLGHGQGGEVRIADSVYARIVPTDFTRQILASATDRLLALQLSNIEWSDLGDPYRVYASLAGKTRDLPGWAKRLPRISTAAA